MIDDGGPAERLEKALKDMRQALEGLDFVVATLLAERDALVAEVERLRREVHPAITHCDNCGCDWLDNGLNPVGCPYCELRRETERKLKEWNVRDVIARVAAGTTTVEDARALEKVLAKANVV